MTPEKIYHSHGRTWTTQQIAEHIGQNSDVVRNHMVAIRGGTKTLKKLIDGKYKRKFFSYTTPDGKIWDVAGIAEHLNVSIPTVNANIKKIKEGVLHNGQKRTYDGLIAGEYLVKSSNYTVFYKNETWLSTKIAAHLNVSSYTARKKVVEYRSGKFSLESLMKGEQTDGTLLEDKNGKRWSILEISEYINRSTEATRDLLKLVKKGVIVLDDLLANNMPQISAKPAFKNSATIERGRPETPLEEVIRLGKESEAQLMRQKSLEKANARRCWV